MNSSVASLVNDLSHPEVYNRKHAAWTLARLAQKGRADEVVDAGAVPKLAVCIGDSEPIVRYRALWALLELAKRGQREAVLGTGVVPAISGMAGDDAVVEICHAGIDEIAQTSIERIARETLELLGGG